MPRPKLLRLSLFNTLYLRYHSSLDYNPCISIHDCLLG